MGQPDAQAIRFPLEQLIEYRHSYARDTDQGIIKNISLTGAYIETPRHRFTEQEKIKINFQVGDRIREVYASVVWIRSNGAGVRFNHVNNQDRQIVDDLIYFVESKRNSRRTILRSIFEVANQGEDGVRKKVI